MSRKSLLFVALIDHSLCRDLATLFRDDEGNINLELSDEKYEKLEAKDQTLISVLYSLWYEKFPPPEMNYLDPLKNFGLLDPKLTVMIADIIAEINKSND